MSLLETHSRPVARDGRPVLPGSSSSEGSGGGWTLLTVAKNGVIAHLIGGRLNEESIEVAFDTSNSAPGAWLHPFGDPMAPVKVYVHRFDLEMARALIDEVEDAVTQGPPIEEPRPSHKAISAAIRPSLLLAVVVAITLMLAFVEIVGFVPCFLHLFCF